MALLLAIVSFLVACCSPSLAAECSAACSSEFLSNCVPFKCQAEQAVTTKAEAYKQCRNELNAGTGPLVEHCAAGCTDTAAMTAESTNTEACPSGGTQPPPGGGGAPAATTTECQVAAGYPKPTVPTACTTANAGCCACPEPPGTTYVLWIHQGTVQRCIHTYGVPTTDGTPKPVVLAMNGYGDGTIGSATKIAANKYGFAVIGVGSTSPTSATGFGLDFGNDGVANATNPTPCSDEDDRDKPYLDAIFTWIAAQGAQQRLNASEVFADGFSQESMYAAHVAVCHADKVKGLWQGGSGLAKTGYSPVVPGYQGQCALSSFTASTTDCCTNSFCEECDWWPLYPRTCGNKLIDCIMSYTDDRVGCGGYVRSFVRWSSA